MDIAVERLLAVSTRAYQIRSCFTIPRSGKWRAPVIASLLVAALLLPLPLSASPDDEDAQRRLVLVAPAESEVSDLSLDDIRRVFLGVPVRHGGMLLEAVINESDPLAYEVFLQSVVFHSARSYERYLVKRVFREGGRRPSRVSAVRDLPSTLAVNEGRISFAWEEWAEGRDDVQVIRELWRGVTD